MATSRMLGNLLNDAVLFTQVKMALAYNGRPHDDDSITAMLTTLLARWRTMSVDEIEAVPDSEVHAAVKTLLQLGWPEPADLSTRIDKLMNER